MSLARQCDSVTGIFQIMSDLLRARVHAGMIRVRSGFDRIDARINVVPSWRAHGSRLKASRELHAFFRQLVQMWSLRLASVDFHVQICAVISNHKHQIGTIIGCDDRGHGCQNQDDRAKVVHIFRFD